MNLRISEICYNYSSIQLKYSPRKLGFRSEVNSNPASHLQIKSWSMCWVNNWIEV